MLTVELKTALGQAQDEINAIIVGKEHCVCLALTALLAGGHLLLEDLPGLGKTTFAQVLAASTGLQCRRIQFTSDILPADILGVSVYAQQQEKFRFHPGPIFSQVVLADEINRAPPRSQSSLLEGMAEQHVTLDGQRYPLPHPFFVIATQNAVDMAGTYPLPDSQLDRFMFRIQLGYPSAAAERQMLLTTRSQSALDHITPRLTPDQWVVLRQCCKNVHTSDAFIDYLLALVCHSRQASGVRVGLSPRASLALLRASQAYALLHGRDFVIPDDIQAIFVDLAAHRLVADNLSTSGAQIAQALLELVAVD